jgi:predicted nuclease of predicted toxin-antitoxin system
VRLLLDEMYPAALAASLNGAGIDATTVAALGLAGASDADVFATAVAGGYVVLTENVADFTRIAAECIASGNHHHGLLIALSSRFSRRPERIALLVAAVEAIVEDCLDDRTVFLQQRPTAG